MMAEALREREEPAWTVARAPPTVPEVEAVTEVPTADETTAATEAATVVLRASATSTELVDVAGMYPSIVSSRMPE